MKKRPKPGKGGRSMRGAKRTDVLQISEPPPSSPETPEAEPAAVPEELLVVTFRLTAAHIAWLSRAAVERKVARGSRGRADVSAVLRELLDDALAKL